MRCAVGTWDFDVETSWLTIAPENSPANDRGRAVHGRAVDELRGSLHPDDIPDLEIAAIGLIDGHSPLLRQRFRLGDGRGGWRWIEATGRASDDRRRLSGVWADVTEAEAESVRKREAISRVHQFAAAASHDLIGPLRHIAMYGEFLVNDFGTGATQEKRRMLEAITEKARSLQVLTKRLIAFSTGTSAPESVALPLDRAIANVRERIASEIEAAGATLEVGPLPDIVGDRVLIEKVFEALLRNAIEWRADHAPIVTIEAIVRGRSAVVVVADNAVGIDERYAGRIFDAFWSLPRRTGEKGAGLGLAVCKTILDALDGEITLRSTSPEGSAFEIVLPLAR